ncbi:hypothetical protein [Poriferisphaera sp. WC338]|uniref:hypothetical protein n=1 Tax=Poriferisphaera sp. WC338 TaxID=3425129 RepID=UPI003D8189FE
MPRILKMCRMACWVTAMAAAVGSTALVLLMMLLTRAEVWAGLRGGDEPMGMLVLGVCVMAALPMSAILAALIQRQYRGRCLPVES